jgi:hypothetical protein
MDIEQVLSQLLLIAGLLTLPAPLLWVEARALQRVPRLAGQSRWRERLALIPRVVSVGALLLSGAVVALYIYYRLSPPEDLQAFLQGRQLGGDATARVNGFYGLLATVGLVTLGTLAVAYGGGSARLPYACPGPCARTPTADPAGPTASTSTQPGRETRPRSGKLRQFRSQVESLGAI